MMERVVNLEEDGTEELAHALYEYYQTTTPRMTKITSICWERGLDLFIDEGRLCAFPPVYARAFDQRDRLELLQRFHQSVMDGKSLLYFVNESRFPFAEVFSLHCQGEKKASFEVHDRVTQLYASILFEEQSLCGALYDFIQSMPDGEWVYSKEESLAILERGVARCEQLVLLDSEHRSERRRRLQQNKIWLCRLRIIRNPHSHCFIIKIKDRFESGRHTFPVSPQGGPCHP